MLFLDRLISHLGPFRGTKLTGCFLFKVPVRFQAVGSAPILRQKVFKVSASNRFETVVNFLRKKLECKPSDSVFLYVNSVFAPGLDEGVGNLYRVRGTDSMYSGITAMV